MAPRVNHVKLRDVYTCDNDVCAMVSVGFGCACSRRVLRDNRNNVAGCFATGFTSWSYVQLTGIDSIRLDDVILD
jgi:hypothetical protein